MDNGVWINYWSRGQGWGRGENWGTTETSVIEQQLNKQTNIIIGKENVPNLVKEIDIEVYETQSVPSKMDAKRPTLRHIIIKMPKFKDKEIMLENQDGGVSRHTEPPRTIRIDRKSNGKEVRHQGDKK